MKTLVIHPRDVTTDFLCEIYSDKDYTVINTNPSGKYLQEQIKSHDRIIMMGHGTDIGLIGFGRMIIDSTWVYLLRQKECVFIWCNADVFVKKYDLKGFYTGMIVSEPMEANMYCLPYDIEPIEESNKLFSDCLRESIDQNDILKYMVENYTTDENNAIILFNKENMFHAC